MFKPVNHQQNFAEQEDTITKFWKEHKIFEKSVSSRSKNNRYVFYDGPPFITGLPHYGHLLGSIAKDVIPRYQTMRGKRVERIWGWDCHGLPIESKVEKKLGIKHRKEVENLGIDKFISECYSYTRETSAEWDYYIDKIGRWVDFKNSYKTMDQEYMESVMWVFAELYKKGLIYEGVRTSLFDTVLGTPISNFEVAMDNSYANVEDPAVTVKFKITTEGSYQNKSMLAWTTTPWTLPANKALVVDPLETYVLAKVQNPENEIERAWLIKDMPDLKGLKSAQITQAYLNELKEDSSENLKSIRIRKINDTYELTKKYFAGDNKITGSQIEKTESISKEKYIELIKQAQSKIVKTRYYLPLENGLTAEIDIYQNNLQGLNVVEVEFVGPKQANNFVALSWFGKEVTDSKGIYPPFIANLSFEEVANINNSFIQEKQDYYNACITEEVILAKPRVEFVLKDMEFEIVEEFMGENLVGLSYEPPFDFIKPLENEHKVYSFENMVNMKEGTGIVHSAPGFGDIDTEMGKNYNLSIAVDVIDNEGKYTEMVLKYKDMYFKNADDYLIAELRNSAKLFKAEKITHRFPFSPRSGVALIQKAQHSWFVDIKKIKAQMLKNNQEINWVPDHLKEGRFAKGIDTAPDWGISRNRFWGTPMPVWQKVEDGNVIERKVISSRDELRTHSVQPITKVIFAVLPDPEADKLEGTLGEKGKEIALAMKTALNEQHFDSTFCSNTQVGSETALLLNNFDAHKTDSLGSKEILEKFHFVLNQLSIKEIFELSNLDETKLQNSFSELVNDVKSKFSKTLESESGKFVLALVSKEILPLLRHIFEGRTLKESFGMNLQEGNLTTMFFLKDKFLDLHRPMIDTIKLKGEKSELERVSEVLDVWMDSASMPYAQLHYPFENKSHFEENFPADFIVEYIGQTRAWFYVMHVIASALFDKPSFKNVVTTGVIFGTDGRKMSKSYGNYPDPKNILNQYGADPLRLYLMGSPLMVGEDMNIDENVVKEQIKNIILPLWNSYSFFVTYANMHNWVPADNLLTTKEESDYDNWSIVPFAKIENKLDAWIITRLQLLIRQVRIGFTEYNLPAVVRELPEFLNDLSRWYIRRSRQRFNNGEQQALDSLYYVLTEIIKLLAPLTPFISEAIYQNIVRDKLLDAPESVHLCDFPELDVKFLENHSKLLMQMEKTREIVALGQSLRVQKGVKIRQPLSEIEIKFDNDPSREFELENWMKDLIKEELNIKNVQEKHELLETKDWEIKKSESSNLEVKIDFNITIALKREGIIRELSRNIQDQRKRNGFNVSDKIVLAIFSADPEVKTTIELEHESLKNSVGAIKIVLLEKLAENQNLKTIKIFNSEVSFEIFNQNNQN